MTHPYFHFRMITLVNINEFSPNLVCALILWRSGLGLLMVKFSHIWTDLSAIDMSIFFSFTDDSFSKYQWIFHKLDMCIDIADICFGFANGQILSIVDSYLPATHPFFSFRTISAISLNGFDQI